MKRICYCLILSVSILILLCFVWAKYWSKILCWYCLTTQEGDTAHLWINYRSCKLIFSSWQKWPGDKKEEGNEVLLNYILLYLLHWRFWSSGVNKLYMMLITLLKLPPRYCTWSSNIKTSCSRKIVICWTIWIISDKKTDDGHLFSTEVHCWCHIMISVKL